MKTDENKNKICLTEFTFRITKIDTPEDFSFDLEAWQADLSVCNWLSSAGENHIKGDTNHAA